MPQVLSVWSSLDMRRRFFVVAAVIATFAAVLGLSQIASRPSMALLYSGLDDQQAGEVINALDQSGARYDVRGRAIYVEESARDRLRMTLARDGLPANTSAGYELLDQLSGFGTTSQMFDAAYWRAKEGELARTIVSGPGIRQARVHISHPGSNPFQRNIDPTASVTVSAAGAPLDTAQAQALRYLVASAVAGLQPADVAIIDAVNGRVLNPDTSDDGQTEVGDRAEKIKANVERLLAAHVGAGNAVVEVSVDTVTERESILERRFDPESRVAISTDTEERSSNATNAGGAGVTVASNLPTGDADAEGNQSQSQESTVRERTNFEVSETTREIMRLPGAIRRLSVAVLINDGNTDSAGAPAPRSEDELTALRDLVAAAVGFNAERGDVITIKSMSFEPVPDLGSGPTVGFMERYAVDAMRLIQLGVLAIVALALGLFVVRPILTGRNDAASNASALTVTPLPSNAIDSAALPATVAETVPSSIGPGNVPAVATPAEVVAAPKADSRIEQNESPVNHLKQLIEERQPDTIAILKNWLEDEPRRETI